MTISIPGTGGWTSVASSTNTTTTVSVLVPSAAAAGDLLLIGAVSERAETPTVRLNNVASEITIGRTESSTNISVVYAWKRLIAADLGGTVAMFNTAARRQALGAMMIRGALDPVFINHAFDGQSTSVTAKTPGAWTPTANNSLGVALWAMARVISPYTGYTFTGSAPWVERVETSGTYTGNIEPTVYISTELLGTGTAGVAQSNVTVTSTTTSWDSIATTVVFAPSVAAGPVARATVIQPIAEIDATGSTAAVGGTLTYSISPSVGVTQPDPGIFLVPYTNSSQTFTITVNESGGGSSTTTATVAAAPGGGTVTNTTGVETVRFLSGAWI